MSKIIYSREAVFGSLVLFKNLQYKQKENSKKFTNDPISYVYHMLNNGNNYSDEEFCISIATIGIYALFSYKSEDNHLYYIGDRCNMLLIGCYGYSSYTILKKMYIKQKNLEMGDTCSQDTYEKKKGIISKVKSFFNYMWEKVNGNINMISIPIKLLPIIASITALYLVIDNKLNVIDNNVSKKLNIIENQTQHIKDKIQGIDSRLEFIKTRLTKFLK